jgi:L-aspartate oxidase
LASLEEAARRLQRIERQALAAMQKVPQQVEAWEDWNLAIVGNLIVQCALRRRESRGLHTLVDFPERDDVNFKRDTVLCRTSIG